MTTEPKDISDDLHALIDATSLHHVLQTLSSICTDEAELVRRDWRDEFKKWVRAADLIGVLAEDDAITSISR